MSNVTVKGMSCQHCVASVTQALEALEGVGDVRVDLDSGVAEYTEEKPVEPEAVRKAIESIGFDVED
ncbi:heavy-metal-associated domain-containing protein [Pseudodesulfovibrio senegalensis]|jgi:copper chaperone|uniref:Heavy-metal-associated domain-containing protein n=1 Tax=Pseudodesulfovibrio senegalensis TaxID=1721087 RepID=A0A6N6N4B2_9BACT|nr:heavy metal-associated domain-containing protein [Pseudodesulfovibrio senegalensis]KAB1442783.1 heavy-metal-associated domain-containing protein [Pseudodesulfovibrio senegalensis]